jgi:hypothetical protein
VLWVAGFIAGGVGALGAAASCDPALKPPEAHPFGYRSRGDRCEGVYIQPVAGTTMIMTSFTQVFVEYDLRSGDPLKLTWQTPGDDAVHLRGRSTKRRLYYRMDSSPPPGVTSYTWPTNVLAALAITRRDIGITAWFQHALGDASRIVHLPLRVEQGAEILPRSTGYQLELVPNRELTEVYVTLDRLDDVGHKVAVIQDAAKLGYGYYPAERVFLVPIPQLPRRGFYRLQLGAVLAGGGSTTLEVWFYHAGG